MIYLDNNATTPLDPRVMEKMQPFFLERFGNPASRQHHFGTEVAAAVEIARKSIAETLNAEPREIIFTSGATESCNLALQGVFHKYRRKGRHFVVVRTEHKAVLDTAGHLGKHGAEITYLDVRSDGLLDLDQLEHAIRTDTVLVAAMWANNETGVIQPMDEIGRICTRKGTMLFSDATQAVGKIPVDPRSCGVQLMAFSAHKFYGPKGAGALYLSQRSPKVHLTPLIYGGGHEAGLRSGTVNAPAFIGMGEALRLAVQEMGQFTSFAGGLRDSMEEGLQALPDVRINGHGQKRLAHVSNMTLNTIDAQMLMNKLADQLAIASGSACTSADPEPSHVLQAMGLSRKAAEASVRISLGRFNTSEEIRRATSLILNAVRELQEGL